MRPSPRTLERRLSAMTDIASDLRRSCEKLGRENVRLKERLAAQKQRAASLAQTVSHLRKEMEEARKKFEDELAKRDATIRGLTNELEKARAIQAHDGTNTGMSTSRTPIGKDKVISNNNSRQKSGDPKGGKLHHEKHSFDGTDNVDTEETQGHPLEEGEHCPGCGGSDFSPTGKSEVKYEYDVRIKLVKIRHEFYYYRCNECGTIFRSDIPPSLKEQHQYGSTLKALLLSLTNTVNASMNKAASFIAGITGGRLTPCEGYVAKLQRKAAKALVPFRSALKQVLITRKLVYWDDTVIFILTKRACFRFYGDERIAYYTAHEHKDLQSLEDDDVLRQLEHYIKVMHDHNTVNYNWRFCFVNIECNQHLQRDCQKNTDDTHHTWTIELKELISITIRKRNDAIKRGEKAFDEAVIADFNRRLDECLEKGRKENAAEPDIYGADNERALIKRLENYRENYFMWLRDFSIPTTNNLSERSLRGIKSHMKISGQFESVEAADNHAVIRSYIETCRRNGINEIDALQRLCDGHPYTVEEIFRDHPL